VEHGWGEHCRWLPFGCERVFGVVAQCGASSEHVRQEFQGDREWLFLLGVIDLPELLWDEFGDDWVGPFFYGDVVSGCEWESGLHAGGGSRGG